MFTGLKSQLDFSDLIMKDIIPSKNDLVKLKELIDWKEINSIYKSCFTSKKGNKTKRTEIVIGLLFLKRFYGLSYRKCIEEVHVNNAFMYFCNISHDEIIDYNKRGKQIIDHSSLIKIIKRLGYKRIKKINKAFTNQLIKQKIINGKILITDTTSVESNIIYPTEINLLNRIIEHAEKIVQKAIFKKNMIRSEIIKKAKQISKIFYSASKRSGELLNKCSNQLYEMAIKTIEKADKTMSEIEGDLKIFLIPEYNKLKSIGTKILKQIKMKDKKEHLKDKIVSYYEDHARPLPKNKVHKQCEFGLKVRIDQSANKYITNYEIYEENTNDSLMLEDAVKEHFEIFKDDFKEAAADRGFYNEDKINKIEEDYGIVLAIPHKKDRTKIMSKRKQKLYNKRSAIEAKISEGKRKAGLGKCYDKGLESHKTWICLSIFILNAKQLLRDLNKNTKINSKKAA